MTYLTLSQTPSSHLGVDLTPTDLATVGSNSGVQFANNGAVGLVVYNGSGAAITVTPQVQRNIEGLGSVSTLAPTAGAISLPAGKMWLFGSYSPQDYNSNGQPGGTMTVEMTGTLTSVGVALISVPTTLP
jgi:hypothetical protein